MQNSSLLVILFSLIILSGCEPAATFDQPQPAHQKALRSIPKRLQGTYLDNEQASMLEISDSLIIRKYDFELKEHKDSLGTSLQLRGDSLADLSTGIKERISLQGDTVIRHMVWSDTLFRISDDKILKKFRGYYFLNSKWNDSAWEVKKIYLEKGRLHIGMISKEDDIEKLKEVSESVEDTTSTYFSPTRKQFIEFIRHDGFTREESFRRVKVKQQ